MPVTDARLSVGFPHHPKTIMLESKLGPAGPWAFVRLILWAAQNKPDGDLKDMPDEYIEAAAGYQGETGTLIKALVEVGFIKGKQSLRRINDWEAHQPWAANSTDRSQKARDAAKARWQGKSKA